MKNTFKEFSGIPVPAIVGLGSCFKGEVETKTDIIVEGLLNGKLLIGGKLIIRSAGKVNSEITECRNADIYGLFEGNLKVTEQLSIHENGRVQGDIKVGKISIEIGGYFNGNCVTLSEESPVPENQPTQILSEKPKMPEIHLQKDKKEKK